MKMKPNLDIKFEVHTDASQNLISAMAELYWTDFVPQELRQANPEFYSKPRFLKRMKGYASRPFFRFITAHVGGELVGFTTTASLIPSSTWWEEMTPKQPPEFYPEDGSRTLAIFDVLVKEDFRGHKIATELHRLSVKDITFQRVTLLSSKPQQPAFDMWLHFGYEIIGNKPMQNGPQLSVFLKNKI